MTGEADDLISDAGEFSILGSWPPSLHRVTDKYHRSPVIFRPILHQLKTSEDVAEVVSILNIQNIPSVRTPLLCDVVALEFRLDYSSYQGVIDTRVIVAQENSQALADLLCNRGSFEFLGVSFSHRKLAF